MENIEVSVDNMSFGSGLVSEIGLVVYIDGEEYYFCADDIVFSIDDIDYDIDYQDRERDVGIDWEGYYVEDFDLDGCIYVDNFYPIDDDGNDISDKCKGILEKYGSTIKTMIEEAITKKLYKDYDDEIEEWILDYVNDHSDYEPDYDDYEPDYGE
jgi:hypothetical protein